MGHTGYEYDCRWASKNDSKYPGYDLVHGRGYESTKGFDYHYSESQIHEQYRSQQRYDWGRKK
ncbi:hypothetical protein HC231_07920 [Brenneria izadpanahii]|uniref:Bacterial toxin 8 domain-containing protein n=1 Tax=Brenneria izadpanahii TaxID=2722756 RepID=A0ABX7UY20_9GAMM|nr:hypothetical protein HC231_07920 [Brenneria izadpanahii]